MFSNNNNTHPYDNTHDNQESISYDNTHDYNNIRDNIPNNNTLFYDAYENFLYDNTHESLPPTYDNNTYYENLFYDVSLPYDTLENLSYDTYLPYDTRKNFSHDVILDYDVPRENLNENLSDCNENQSNQDYETSDNEDELVELTDSLELIAGLTFNSWDEFKSWINRFALKEGFSYKIRSSEKIKGMIRRVAYECIKSGSNTSQVTSDPTKRRNASSSKTSCPWKLNVTYPKTSGVIKINSFNNEHNHSLTSIVHEIAPRFQKLMPEMLVDIEKYVIQGQMDSASIYPLLKHDYPDQPIYKKDLYNAVYQFRKKNNPGDTDASQMLELLMQWKDSNPLWIVKLRLDPVSRKLKSLLWMSPTQKELYNKYNDVTIIDTTYNTNRFQMMLCIIAVVDNNYKSRIFATAIIDDETLNTYRWLFDAILTETAAAKYLSDTLYINKESWAISWIHKRFTTGAQSTQRIESINRHIHDKVDQATSLYDLLLSIKDHVRNEEHFEYFEFERNAIPTIGMPMLNTRFFGSVDNVMKVFLTPIMLGKQRSQMNQSVCYDINRITEWQNLIDVEIDNEEISNGIREQEQDVRQILFKSLIKNIPPEAILEVCRWYLDINIQLDNLSPISVCGTQTEDRVGMKKSITFRHFFSFRVDSHVSNLAIKSTKAIYAELFGLSKKAIDCALKANMQHELMNLLKSFIYDTHNKNVEIQETQETFTDINNPAITKHKGRPPKRFKSSVKTLGKRVLKNSTKVNMITDNVIVEEETNNTKGRKCGKCKQYGHYAKTCQNSC
ncbi:unnamed protein product [Rhizophagus irregularis]|nr:unnamed protein product [Rhizophagus irregularis]